LWGKLTAQGPILWQGLAAMQRVPRFDHLYPQSADSMDHHVDFAFRVQSQFPLVIKTGNREDIVSHFTNMPKS
jgi:hypothetical protein